ncbi:hypothetical protein U0D62_19180 [Aquimarina sp. 2201CG5-10]|nr:hypothetical protein [Aquimarina sp. 2201CG5-10]
MKSIKKDNSFVIIENPKSFYQGIYVKEKPYNGYFKKDDVELFTVDYYEEGIKKYNYSTDVLQQMYNDDSEGDYRLKLGVKSIYKDGEIYDGVKHHYIKDGILAEYYEEGKIKGFHVDIFAIHYFNRISFEKRKNVIEMKSMQDQGYKIKLFSKNNFITAELLKNDSTLIRMQNIDEQKSIFPADSYISIYEEFGEVKGLSYQNFDTTFKVYDEAQIMVEIFNQLEIYNAKDPVDIFNQFLEDIIVYKGFLTKNKVDDPPNAIGDFSSDEKGRIKDGIRFFKNENYYREYKNGKITKEEKITIIDFQKVFSVYLNKKYTEEE